LNACRQAATDNPLQGTVGRALTMQPEKDLDIQWVFHY
jgi:hypothetical protein